MKRVKGGIGFILLLVVPAAIGELLANIYNMYVPIYLQTGNPEFSSNEQVLTQGFGLGAFLVGIWLIVDNILALAIQPWIGAWSDRIHSRLGRRLPFVLFTLPVIILGYALIPVIPNLIPVANDQISKPVMPLALFALVCSIFYLGYIPVRVIFQTLRHEAVEPGQRSKVEAWYTFLFNIFVIISYTAGSVVYKKYPALLFWILLIFYLVACIILLVFYREPPQLAQANGKTESSNLKLLAAIFMNQERGANRNLYFYLASVFLLAIAMGGSASFNSSWVVNVLKVNEAEASAILSASPFALVLVVLPAGYLAAGKLGKKVVYISGIFIMVLGATLITLAPRLYLPSFIMMGAGSGITFSSQLALLFDVSPQQRVSGALVGIYNVAYFLGFTMGSIIVGAIIEQTSYLSLFPTLLIFGISSALCAWFLKLKKLPVVAFESAISKR